MEALYKLFVHSPMNWIEITGTNRGLRSLYFVEEKGVMDDNVPNFMTDTVGQLDEYFHGQRRRFTIPLDMEGTNFQIQVWKELLKIPFGETRSYLDIALALGNKKSTRAVGAANGQNKISIIVPCHRVIGSAGKLTGYAGGLHRKQWLLGYEHKFTLGEQAELF